MLQEWVCDNLAMMTILQAIQVFHSLSIIKMMWQMSDEFFKKMNIWLCRYGIIYTPTISIENYGMIM